MHEKEEEILRKRLSGEVHRWRDASDSEREKETDGETQWRKHREVSTGTDVFTWIDSPGRK